MIRLAQSALVRLETNSRYQLALLAAITGLAGALRFYRLGEWSFWIDEIFTINDTRLHFSDLSTVIQNLPTAPWLPLSVILTNGSLTIFGINEWSARLVSSLIGTVAVPILYFPTKRVFSAGVAVILALLLAISPWHLFWSQNARFYTSLMLLYTLASLAFFFGIEHDRPGYIVIFFALVYFALSEALIAIFILPVIACYLAALWLLRLDSPTGLRRRNIFILLVPVILAAAFEVFRLVTTGVSPTIPPGWSANSALYLEWFIGQHVRTPPRLFIAIVFNIGLPIVSLALMAGLYLLFQRNRAGLFLLVSAVLPVVLLVLLNPVMFTKDRYAFITLPSWLMLAAVAVRDLITRTQGLGKLLAIGVVAALLAEAAGTNLLYYQVNNGGRKDWRTAFEIIKDRGREDDLVVAFWPEFSPFYLGREIIPWRDIRPEAVINAGSRCWFLLDSETIWVNPEMKDWVPRNAELIEVLYLRLPEENFNLRLYLYDPAKNSLEQKEQFKHVRSNRNWNVDHRS